MGDTARDIKNDPLAIEGLEEIFTPDCPAEFWTVDDRTTKQSGNVQDHPTRGAVKAVEPELLHPISVEEASRLLGISQNAVCKRLRKGSLVGKKTLGKFKDEWLVEGDGLIEILNVVQERPIDIDHDFSQSRTFQEDTTDSAHPVQDGTLDSPDRSDHSMDRLVDLVEKQTEKLEKAAQQIGYLQAQLESQTKLIEAKNDQIKLLTDRQHAPGGFRRFWKWFTSS